MSSPLSDKTIFITGSGGVLGTAYVNTLLENGATVVASDLPGHRADTMKERFGTYANFAYYDLDVGSEEEIEAIFKTMQADGLNPNVVLNNAAITGELLMGAGKSFPRFCQYLGPRLGKNNAGQPNRCIHDRPTDGS